MIKTLFLLILFTPLKAFADLGTVPVSYSCDEMYYAFYYDYEKVRTLWQKFSSPRGQCNAQVIDWVAQTEESTLEHESRAQWPYAVMDKNQVVDLLKSIRILPQHATLSALQSSPDKDRLLDQAPGFRPLLSQDQLKNKIQQQKQVAGSFLANHREQSWKPPVVGQGASSVSPYGYFRIDQIGPPLEYDEVMALRCSDIYRGFGQCEQDCIYLRTIAVDMHSKIRLFLKEWDWENDKMICTAQSSVKGSIVPFDSSYCKESCPSSITPCSTCSFRLKEDEEKPHVISCLSEADARHASDLYCFLNGQKAGCQKVQCNTTYNLQNEESQVTAAQNSIQEFETDTYVFGKEFGGKLNAIGQETGYDLNIDLSATIKYGFNLYTMEGPMTIQKYFAERSDGKLFECSKEAMERHQNASCEDVYGVDIDLCRQENWTFSKCQNYTMGDGRAFYNCSAEFESLDSTNHKGFAGFNADLTVPLLGGANVRALVSYGKSTQITSSIVAESKKFNAGGLTWEHMKAECKRWTDQWFQVSLDSLDINTDYLKLVPSHWFETSSQSLKNKGYKTTCKGTDLYGEETAVNLSAIDVRLEQRSVQREKEVRSGQKVTTMSYADSERVLRVSFDIQGRLNGQDLGGWNNFWTDALDLDTSYPPPQPPMKKGWFEIPFDSEMGQYLTLIHNGELDKDMLSALLTQMGETKRDEFILKDCRVE